MSEEKFPFLFLCRKERMAIFLKNKLGVGEEEGKMGNGLQYRKSHSHELGKSSNSQSIELLNDNSFRLSFAKYSFD